MEPQVLFNIYIYIYCGEANVFAFHIKRIICVTGIKNRPCSICFINRNRAKLLLQICKGLI
jgi:hypothetical protein